MFPNDTVPGSYNVSFNNKKTNPIITKELSAQMIERGLDNYERIVILGGKNYEEMANEVFSSKEILTPLSDCKRVGYMMSKLNDSIKREVPL